MVFFDDGALGGLSLNSLRAKAARNLRNNGTAKIYGTQFPNRIPGHQVGTQTILGLHHRWISLALMLFRQHQLAVDLEATADRWGSGSGLPAAN